MLSVTCAGCLPRLEVLEAAGCTLLSCNIAWHSKASTPGDGGGSQGFASLGTAVHAALADLQSVRAPAAPAAPAFKVTKAHLYAWPACCLSPVGRSSHVNVQHWSPMGMLDTGFCCAVFIENRSSAKPAVGDKPQHVPSAIVMLHCPNLPPGSRHLHSLHCVIGYSVHNINVAAYGAGVAPCPPHVFLSHLLLTVCNARITSPHKQEQ